MPKISRAGGPSMVDADGNSVHPDQIDPVTGVPYPNLEPEQGTDEGDQQQEQGDGPDVNEDGTSRTSTTEKAKPTSDRAVTGRPRASEK